MSRKLTGVLAALAVMAAPTAIALGGGNPPDRAVSKGKGSLVAKDSAKKRPAAAVARVTLKDFGKVSYAISSKPGHLPIDWAVTVRCVKGSLIDYYPGPGDVHTTTKNATIKGTYPIPLKDPDSCTFAVAGQIHKNDLGKRVITKIYNKG
jgi:hypothetical protein